MTLLDLWAPAAIGLATTAMFILLCGLIEHISPVGDRLTVRQRLPGLLLSLLSSPLSLLFLIPLQALYGLAGIQPLIPLAAWLEPLGQFSMPAAIAVSIVVADLLAYWRHRAEHRWFWPIHVVHHSPTALHAANAYGHPAQVLPGVLLVLIPMSLVDFGSAAVPLVLSLVLGFLQVFIHCPTDIGFGPLRRLLVEPRYHRIHHSIEPRHIDRNFGITLSLWDQVFGTAHFPAPDEWPEVGVAGSPPPSDFAAFLLYPVKRGRRLQIEHRGIAKVGFPLDDLGVAEVAVEQRPPRQVGAGVGSAAVHVK